MRRAEPYVLDHRREAVRVVGQGEARGEIGRAPGARLVPGDDGELPGESLELRPPETAVRHGAVGEHDRTPLAGPLILDVDAAGVDYRHGSTVTTASAATPSSRPTKPMPSPVEALTLTRFDREPERARQRYADRVAVRSQLRALHQHGGVGERRSHPGLAGADDRLAQQAQRVGVLEGRVGVGEVLPDVPQPRGAEQRVGHGVCEHIGVRVPYQPAVVRDRHAAQDERPALHEAVRVPADPGPVAHPIGSRRRSRRSNTASSLMPRSSSSASASS